jgi:hypothetical protein
MYDLSSITHAMYDLSFSWYGTPTSKPGQIRYSITPAMYDISSITRAMYDLSSITRAMYDLSSITRAMYDLLLSHVICMTSLLSHVLCMTSHSPGMVHSLQ